MNRALVRLLAVLAVLVLGPIASAQRDAGVSASVSFGYGDSIVAEQWSPVRIVLTSESRTIAGLLTLRHRQDSSQDVAVTVPVSLLPGQTVVAEVIVNLPKHFPGVEVELRDITSGRIILRDFLNTRQYESRRIAFTAPNVLYDRSQVLALGFDQFEEIARDWNRNWMPAPGRVYTTPTQQEEQRTAERAFTIHVLSPDQAASTWAAYDGIRAIIANASSISRLNERARRAMLDWVHGGGELVLVIDDASNVWRSWLPPGEIGNVIDVHELHTHAAPQSFSLIQEHARKSKLHNVEASATATELRARAIAINSNGAALGWKGLHALEENPSMAIIASGPAGFGKVTILGFNPGQALALRSRSGTTAAWGAFLTEALSIPEADHPSHWTYYSPGSGGDQKEMEAIAAAVDDLIQARGISGKVIVALILILLIAVVGVGPIDGLLLRKMKLRHWSWATACGWVALASLLAFAVPIIGRDGSSHIGRATITDAIFDSRGEATVSWNTGVTVSYAGASGPIGPDDDRPGGWWRGVSPLDSWNYGNEGAKLALPAIRLEQFARASSSGAVLGTLARLPSQRVWTVRALLDVAPAQAQISARAYWVDGEVMIEVRTADTAAQLQSLRVVHNGTSRLTNEVQFSEPIALGSMLVDEIHSWQDSETSEYVPPWTRQRQLTELSDTSVSHLPGASRRSDALRSYGASPMHAVVIVSYRPSVSDVPLVGADEFDGFSVARLIVPVLDMPNETNP